MENTQKQVQEKKGVSEEYKIVRILSKDIEGGMTLYAGLTKIKGISWSISNAICVVLGFDKRRKVGSLNEEEMKTLLDFIKNPKFPEYLLNRRSDFEEGSDGHLVSSDLELRKEFDIKRLKKIKNYRGFRHMAGLPLRGQRTKSNFRTNRRKGAGIKKKGKTNGGKK